MKININPRIFTNRKWFLMLFLTLNSILSISAHADLVGYMAPPQGLTIERIQELAPNARPEWYAYLKHSNEQRLLDKFVLEKERALLLTIPLPPEDGNGIKSMPLDKDNEFYKTPEARHIADVIVSFQTPAGGWGKNQPRDSELRKIGQAFVAHDNRGDQEGSNPKLDKWSYVGTIDNDATITELRFLIRISSAIPNHEGDIYRDSIQRGISIFTQCSISKWGMASSMAT